MNVDPKLAEQARRLMTDNLDLTTTAVPNLDWVALRQIGRIDQLRSSYLVVLAVPPLLRLIQLAESQLENELDQFSVDVSVGWHLPVAYLAALFLAIGKLTFDTRAPVSIKEFETPQHLYLHARAAHEPLPLESAKSEGIPRIGVTMTQPEGSTLTLAEREEARDRIDILGPSSQTLQDRDAQRGGEIFWIEVSSNLAFRQWNRDRSIAPGSRWFCGLTLAIGAGLSLLLIADGLGQVLNALFGSRG